MGQKSKYATVKDAQIKPNIGVCFRHGAYLNPLDESTAFDPSHRSAHDDTTATLPNHPNAAASINQERGRNPPSVIVCQVIDHVEV